MEVSDLNRPLHRCRNQNVDGVAADATVDEDLVVRDDSQMMMLPHFQRLDHHNTVDDNRAHSAAASVHAAARFVVGLNDDDDVTIFHPHSPLTDSFGMDDHSFLCLAALMVHPLLLQLNVSTLERECPL